MARMPANTPTIKVRADSWLPDEWIEIVTYGGAAAYGAIADAMTVIEMDPATRRVTAARYTLENSAVERRRQAVKGWQLFSEEHPGVAGAAIPFTPTNVDNLDPDYARWLNTRILEEWAKWDAVTTGGPPSTNPDPTAAAKEDAQTRKTFPSNPADAPAGDQDTDTAAPA